MGIPYLHFDTESDSKGYTEVYNNTFRPPLCSFVVGVSWNYGKSFSEYLKGTHSYIGDIFFTYGKKSNYRRRKVGRVPVEN